MCMSGGGGGSAKKLRTGQLGVNQRSISTSRVASYDLQKKGWSNTGDKVTTTSTIKNTPNRGQMGFARTPYQEAQKLINKANPVLTGFGISNKKPTNTVTEDFGGPPKGIAGFGVGTPKYKVGQTRDVGTNTYTKNKDGTITKTTVSQKQTYEAAKWNAQMAKVELNRSAVDDGSQARRKSRGARMGVANANAQSRFSSKRPKTGSLRIDTSGAQVSG